MEDNLNEDKLKGIWLKWKTTSTEANFNRRRPQSKTTSMEYDHNESQTQRKLIEDDLIGRLPQLKNWWPFLFLFFLSFINKYLFDHASSHLYQYQTFFVAERVTCSSFMV